MSDAKRSEDLIAVLAASAEPARRLPPPMRRAALWLALAVAIVAASVLWHGVDAELAAELLEPLHFAEWLAALATGVGGIVAAFHLTLPDRSPRWAWLALAPAGAWLATVGLGCLGDYLAMGGAAFAWGEPWLCLEYITQLGVPLTLLSLVMLRHAGPIRPMSTMLLAGLGMSGLSAAGLAFFHPDHTAWLGLLWHGAAFAVVLASGALGAALLRRLYAPRREV
ncbi:MAG: NrsF family protein [Alphaproteobacteria bacterium]